MCKNSNTSTNNKQNSLTNSVVSTDQNEIEIKNALFDFDQNTQHAILEIGHPDSETKYSLFDMMRKGDNITKYINRLYENSLTAMGHFPYDLSSLYTIVLRFYSMIEIRFTIGEYCSPNIIQEELTSLLIKLEDSGIPARMVVTFRQMQLACNSPDMTLTKEQLLEYFNNEIG